MDYPTLQQAVRENTLPQHIAVIMDGNGRWGKSRGGRYLGHRAGAEALRRIVEESRRIGIEYLTVFAFSTENWSRPAEEIDLLMKLLSDYLDNETDNLLDKDIKLNFIGDEERLSPLLQKKMAEASAKTAACSHMTFTIALNYGGRQELVHAARKLASAIEAGNLSAADIDEKTFEKALYTADIPDVDLLLRTSGEKRVSNFLLWQIAYAELVITDTLWPDFDEMGLLTAIYEYQHRNRRFGNIK